MAAACAQFLISPQSLQHSTCQLRIYEIFEQNKATFHARFRDHAMRIMSASAYGFDLLATWEAQTGERRELVYLARCADDAGGLGKVPVHGDRRDA